MAVDECVCKEESAFLGVQDVHGAEVLVARTYADDLFRHLDGIAVFGVQSGNESIRLSSFHHHHAEVVALKHLVVGFFVGYSFTGTLFGKNAGIAFAASGLIGMAQVHNFNAFQIEFQFFCQFLYGFVISQ